LSRRRCRRGYDVVIFMLSTLILRRRHYNDAKTLCQRRRRCHNVIMTPMTSFRRRGHRLRFIDVIIATLSGRHRRHDDIDTSTGVREGGPVASSGGEVHHPTISGLGLGLGLGLALALGLGLGLGLVKLGGELLHQHPRCLHNTDGYWCILQLPAVCVHFLLIQYSVPLLSQLQFPINKMV